MKAKINLFFFLLLILFSFAQATESTDTTHYDLSTISKEGKIHVTSNNIISGNYGNAGINYIIIPKEAYNLEIKPDYLSYKIYSNENQEKLEKDISWCYPSDPNKKSIKANSDENIILFDALNIPEEPMEVTLDYDQPLQTKKTKIFTNWAGFAGEFSNIEIRLPSDSYLWHYSKEYTEKIIDEENTLVIRWQNISKLEVAFGSPSEYLIYDSQKDNLVNNYVTLSILVLTIIFSFIFNTNLKEKSRSYINKNINFYQIFLSILTLYFILIPFIFGGILQPFLTSYVKNIGYFFALFFIVSIIVLKVIYKIKNK